MDDFTDDDMLEGIEYLVKHTPCQCPIQVPKVNAATGELRWFDRRCHTRYLSLCPSCSGLYSWDARTILMDGILAAQEAGWHVVFLTLTAPSFGRVHSVANKADGPPRRCSCGRRHHRGSGLAGVPLNPSAYRYRDQVMWNSHMSLLWNRLITNLRKHLKSGVQYFGAVEPQARGAMHLHAFLLVPPDVDLELGVDGQAQAIRRVVRRVTLHRGDRVIRWGSEHRAEIVDSLLDAERRSRYLVKVLGYTVKDLGNDLENGRFRSEEQDRHYVRLTKAAMLMECACRDPKQRVPRRTITVFGVTGHVCRSPRHRNFGRGGHAVLKSRGWSTLTFGSLRGDRAAEQGGADQGSEWLRAEGLAPKVLQRDQAWALSQRAYRLRRGRG